MNRRDFLGKMAIGSLGLLVIPALLKADDDGGGSSLLFKVPTNTGITGNVVIVGGGMAGATLAKYLRMWGGTGVNVTLIEKAASYTSNIMSNKVLTGQLNLADLNYVYDTLTGHYGVRLLRSEVTAIDPVGKTVTILGDSMISYDRLVLAPGLEFDLLPGMSSLSEYDQLIPHAWQAGPQTQLLRDQLLALKAGTLTGDVVITIPKAPYRCPPGPYERICVVADWLKTNNVNSRVVVLDGNADIIVEKDNFAAAFRGDYGYVVDYRPGCILTNVNSSSRTVNYTDASGARVIQAGVLNAIPPQRAPQLLADAGLYNPAVGERFAPVDVLSYKSTRLADIHVIGDASLTTQPKAGHIGNQQGKTCADAILRSLQGKEPDPAPVTNSACFTPITATTATWLSAVYQYAPATGKMVIPSQHNAGTPIAAMKATTKNYQNMLVWFKSLMSDTFG
jgi:NADPH-dependent 2,4-dienoyl-CoA reductase/sulfur reductase-like enzyme